MKIYSILLFVVFLNLVMGFTFTMIDEGYFLPEAQGVLKNPNSSASESSVQDILDRLETMVQNPSIITIIEGGVTILLDIAKLFMEIVSTPAELLSSLISVPEGLTRIITFGMTLITCMTLIQLFTGRWFSFVE